MGTAAIPARKLETHEVQISEISKPAFRLDAAHYRDDFSAAATRVTGAGIPVRKLRTMADAFVPGRTKLVTVAHSSAGAPYLRAHDAFEIRPNSNRFVAKGRTKNYDRLLLKKGMILTPSSGRNLGPIAYVGEALSGFAMTDIMRIVPETEEYGYYLLAYLLTPTAQSLIKRGRSGTNIDHLAPEDVLDIDVPWIESDALRNEIISTMRLAERNLDEGRTGLNAAVARFHELAKITPSLPDGNYLSRTGGDAFAKDVRNIGLRLDAAFHDPTVSMAAATLKAAGGVPLGQIAQPKMLGRYKRFYVDAPHGRPILSGRQILQLRQVALKRISDRSFKKPEEFLLKANSTIFTCDGRSEEALGEPGYVVPAWDGWMASNHVMRLTPLPGITGGYLYLAISSPWVQSQLKASASGSVVDALDPGAVAQVIVPMISEVDRDRLGNEVERCWELISRSMAQTEQAVAKIETALDITKRPI